jgi:hypothetical protein
MIQLYSTQGSWTVFFVKCIHDVKNLFSPLSWHSLANIPLLPLKSNVASLSIIIYFWKEPSHHLVISLSFALDWRQRHSAWACKETWTNPSIFTYYERKQKDVKLYLLAVSISLTTHIQDYLLSKFNWPLPVQLRFSTLPPIYNDSKSTSSEILENQPKFLSYLCMGFNNPIVF